MKRVSIIVLISVALASCASAPAAPPPRTAPAATPALTADELFARGRYAAALDAYRSELKRGERVPEVRTMVLVAQLAQLAPGWSIADDLRAIESDYSSSRWGRIAGVIAAEIERGTVLRRAVMEAGADLRAAKAGVADLETKVGELKTQVADQLALVASLKDERTRMQAQVRDLEEHATQREARIRELEAELLALKQIDMERRP